MSLKDDGDDSATADGDIRRKINCSNIYRYAK